MKDEFRSELGDGEGVGAMKLRQEVLDQDKKREVSALWTDLTTSYLVT